MNMLITWHRTLTMPEVVRRYPWLILTMFYMHYAENRPLILTSNVDKDGYQIGEHVAAFWVDNSAEWFLGIVDSIQEENIYISYLTKSDVRGFEWMYPEEAEIIETAADQILSRNLEVQYKCSVRIRCQIQSNDLVDQLNEKVKEMDNF